jgi:anti-sigma factor (TIGR02949 family)
VSCRELIAVLDDYLEGTLAADLLRELERHLAECPPCRAYLATYRRTREVAAAAANVVVPEELKARLRQLLGVSRTG